MKLQHDEGLSREIGIAGVAINVLNLTVGAGIFVLPAVVYAKLGSSTFLAYIICSVLIFLLMMCFAEIGSRSSSSGSVQASVQEAFGPYAAFITSNLYWFGFGLISDAAIANALLEMVSVFSPFLQTLAGEVLFFLLVFGTLSLINIRGVKYGAILVRLLTIGKLIPLVLLLVLGWSKIDSSNLVWMPDAGVDKLGDGCLLLFFAFVGGEATLMASGEIKSPRQSIPIGLFVGITAAVTLYLLMQVVGQGVLGPNLITFKESPFLQISSIIFGELGSLVILVASALAILGAVSGDMLVMPRLLFAASKSNIFPNSLSVVHSRFKTPHLAILAYAFLGFVFSLSASFKKLAILSSAACLVTYLVVVLSLMKVRRYKKEGESKLFTVNKFLLPLAVVGILWLLSHISHAELVSIFFFCAMLSLYFFRKQVFMMVRSYFS